MPPQIIMITAAPKYVVVCRIAGIEFPIRNSGRLPLSNETMEFKRYLLLCGSLADRHQKGFSNLYALAMLAVQRSESLCCRLLRWCAFSSIRRGDHLFRL